MAEKKPTPPPQKPGGRMEVFQAAVKRANALSWDQKWEEAIKYYQAALAEFPEDGQTLASLGMALFTVKRYQEALPAYQRAARQNPQDTAALEKIADIEERLGHIEEAARVYVAVAEAFLQKRDIQAAIDNWTRACRLAPSLLGAHQRLALAYERLNKTRLAVREYLAIARIFEQRGEAEKAIQACQRALTLDPRNQDVLTALDLLRSGDPDKHMLEDLIPETMPAEATPAPSASSQAMPTPSASTPALASDGGVPAEQAPEERASPVESARQRALTNLAESLFSESGDIGQGRGLLTDAAAAGRQGPRMSKIEIDTLISQAIDYQTRGNVGAALNKYEQVLASGVDLPAANFNLGLLYQQLLRFDDAIEQFKLAIRDQQYQLGGHFALGECYRARGKIDEAVRHFVEVLQIVDMSTVRHEQADDLIQLYNSLADTMAAKGEQEQAISFLNSLVGFLSEKGWEDKVLQARQRLDDLAGSGMTISLAEVFSIPGSDRLLESLSMGQEYMRRNILRTAMEETYRSIQLAPTYLPAHMHMAELLHRDGFLDEASTKYLMVAEVYRVRGDTRRSIGVYEQALRLSPMDLSTRSKVIDMLIRHGEIDRALDHYLQLADGHYQLAQVDKARDKYREALKLAPRGSGERNWPVVILHHMGDIDMQRLNWRDALTVYEQIRKLDPEDERAVVTLIELYYKMNQNQRAVTEVEYLLRMLDGKGKGQKALAILEDLAKTRPSDMALRALLAQAYRQRGRNADAIEQMDALAELQHAAGMIKEATVTVHAILEMHPADAADYERILADWKSKGG